jgi:hypothetical protein
VTVSLISPARRPNDGASFEASLREAPQDEDEL